MADDFDTGAEVSLTVPIRAGEIKKGMTVILKDHPCKVVEISTSKTGKHGHAKANITGIDIFSGKKYQDISPTSHNMTKPVVKMERYMIIDVTDDGFAVLFNEDTSETREDIRVPDSNSPDPDLGKKITDRMESGDDVFVTLVCAMNKEAITGLTT